MRSQFGVITLIIRGVMPMRRMERRRARIISSSRRLRTPRREQDPTLRQLRIRRIR